MIMFQIYIYKVQLYVYVLYKGRSPEKNCCYFGFCPNYLTPSLFGQLVFFTDIYVLYMQPITQFEVQIIGILEYNGLLLLAKKYTCKKVPKNLGRPSPLIWTKTKRTAVFSEETASLSQSIFANTCPFKLYHVRAFKCLRDRCDEALYCLNVHLKSFSYSTRFLLH